MAGNKIEARPMLEDGYDKTLMALLAAALAALFILLASEEGIEERKGAAADKAMEVEMAYQARVSLLQKIYAPAEDLIKNGDLQRALFKLDELAQKYPSEAHGLILKAGILRKMGALDEALRSYVDGVRLNGDYLDRKSPLSRRGDIEQAAEEGSRSVRSRLAADPHNLSLAASLKDVNYLRSRLAGGCE